MVVLKSGQTKIIAFVSVLLLIISFYPWLHDNINSGQMIKQTSTVEIINGYRFRPINKGFSTRIYNEIFHAKSRPWTEEIPLFHLSSLVISSIFNVSSALGAKLVSLLSYFLALLALFKIGTNLNPHNPGKSGLMFCLVFCCFPIFRIYAVSAMPEIMMISFCSWAFYYSRLYKKIKVSLFLSLACMAKFYAIFWSLGLFLYSTLFFKEPKKILEKANIRLACYYLLIPSILIAVYLAFIFSTGINNPIQDYAAMGMSHSFDFDALFSKKFLSRSFTWIFLKNSEILLSLLSLGSLFFLVKEQKSYRTILSFLIPQLIFAFIFAKTFIIHDYYAIQINLLMALMVALFLTQFDRAQKKIFLALIVFALPLSIYRHHRMTRPSNFVSLAAQQLESVAPRGRGLVISDRAPETILQMAQVPGWRLKTDEPNIYPKLGDQLRKRLQEESFDWLQVSGFGNIKARWRKYQEDFPQLLPYSIDKKFSGQNFSIFYLKRNSP